jgi:hypothetical protein
MTDGEVQHVGWSSAHGEFHLHLMVDGKLMIYRVPDVRFWSAASSMAETIRSSTRDKTYQVMKSAPVDFLDV